MIELPEFVSYHGKEYGGGEIFKLVFRREDGKFLGVEAEANNIEYLTHAQMKNKTFKYTYPFPDVPADQVSFADLLPSAKIETFKFIDICGKSVCGGSCGGIGFNWC